MSSLKKDIEAIILKSQKEKEQECVNWDNIRFEKHEKQRVMDIVALKECSESALSTILGSYMEEASKHDNHNVEATMLVCQAMAEINATEKLLDASTNITFQWYGRMHAINSLNFCGDVSSLSQLLPILDERTVEGEIREAVIKALSSHGIQEVLPKIENIENDPDILDSWWDARRHLLAAKARLGVDSALRPLINMCYDEWEHTRVLGVNALAQFTKAKEGLKGVLNVLTPFDENEAEESCLKRLIKTKENSEVKRWAMDNLFRLYPDEAYEVLITALGSSDWHVSHHACKLLSNFREDISESLTLLASDINHTRNERLWAMASLALGSKKPSMSFIADLDDIKVPWLFKCPEIVRSTIINEYGLDYESFTDVRYLIEAANTKHEEFDNDRFREKLIDRLDKEGFTIHQTQDCGRYHGSGGGTYDVVETDKGQFFACTIGPFLAASNIIEHTTGNVSVHQDPKAVIQLRNIITSLGGLWLEDDLLGHEVPKLNVYFFGDREPLTVGDLIFYWQD